MTATKPTSSYLKLPLRSFQEALQDAGRERWYAWFDTRATCKDFIAECAHADDRHSPRSHWRKLFFKLLRARLLKGEDFTEALDAVGYGDCAVECERIRDEVYADIRAERVGNLAFRQ
ncbi:hypothetical protein [Pelagibius sp.]|uniref:hypothetical protein n=1 Tax=Pelagibius sp. TaxID=1931238 RepID=UPI003BAF10D3